jgi:acyl carrier protein
MIGSENMLNDQINSINNMIEKVSMFKSCLEHYNEDSIQNADYEFQRIYENFNEIVKHMCETLSKVISYEYDMLTYIDRELPDSFIKDNNNMYTDLMNRIIVVHNYINQLFSEFMTVSDFHKLKTELNYNSYPALIADTDGNTVIVHLPYLPKKKVIFNDRIENDLMVNLLDNLMLSKEIPQMKEKIIAILSDLRPEFDFTDESLNFIEEGMLDSFDVVCLVDALDTEFNIVIDGIDILPENFSTIESIEALLKKNGVTE